MPQSKEHGFEFWYVLNPNPPFCWSLGLHQCAIKAWMLFLLWGCCESHMNESTLRIESYIDDFKVLYKFNWPLLSHYNAWMWELDHKERWVLKNWWFWTVVLEKTLESPLGWKEIKSVNPKGNYPWIFIGRTDAEAEALILWPPGVKNWLIGKDPDAGKDWGQEKMGAAEDEMVGWHYPLSGREFEQTPGDSEGQGGLVCCNTQGNKEWDMT